MTAMPPQVTSIGFISTDVGINGFNAYAWLAIPAELANNLSRGPLLSGHLGAYEIAYPKCQVSVVLEPTLAVSGFDLRLLPVVAAFTTVALEFST